MYHDEKMSNDLLNKLHTLVIRREPLKERLSILHRLAKNSGPGNKWENDILQHERKRILEIERQYGKTDDDSHLEEIRQELECFTLEDDLVREYRLRIESKALCELREHLDRHDPSSPKMKSACEELLREFDSHDWLHPEAESLREDIANRLHPILLTEEKAYFENLRDEILSNISKNSGWLYGKKIYLERKKKELSQRDWIHSEGSSFMHDVEDLYKKIESGLSTIQIRNRIFQITSASLLFIVLCLWARNSIVNSRRKNEEAKRGQALAAEFIDSVSNQSTHQADEIFLALSKDHKGLLNTPDVIKAKSNLEKNKKEKVEHLERFSSLEKQCRESIEASLDSFESGDTPKLNNNALDELKIVAGSDEEKGIVDAFVRQYESIAARATARTAESTRIEEFHRFFKKAKDSTMNGGILDHISLKAAGELAKLPNEKESLERLSQDFLRIENAVKEAERKENFNKQCDYVEASIKKAMANPDVFDPDFLDQDALTAAKSFATSNEKHDVDRLEQEFNEIKKTAERQTKDRTVREFDLIYRKAIDSYAAANGFEDGPNETLLDGNALEIALKFVGTISARQEHDVKTLKEKFEKLKRNATVQRNKRLADFVSEHAKELERIEGDVSLSPVTKLEQLETLLSAIRTEGERISKLADEGRFTDKSIRAKASNLFKETKLILDKIRPLASAAVDLEKITEAVDEPSEYRMLLKRFASAHPDSRQAADFSKIANYSNDYWKSIQDWNSFVVKHAIAIDFYSNSNGSGKEIFEFITSNDARLSFVPEFSILKERKSIYSNWTALPSFADKIRQRLESYKSKKLWFLKTPGGQYCYFENELIAGKNTCFMGTTRQNTQSASLNLSEDDLKKVALAPQISLVEKIDEKLKSLSVENKIENPKAFYVCIVDLLRIVLDDDATDPIIKYFILDDVVTILSQNDLFLYGQTGNWKNNVRRNGISRTINWANPLDTSLAGHRNTAANSIKDFPIEDMDKIVRNTSEKTTRPFWIRPPASVEYRRIGWLDADDSGRFLVRWKNDSSKKDNLGLSSDSSFSLLAIVPKQTAVTRSGNSTVYTMMKVGIMGKRKIELDQDLQLTVGSPLYIPVPIGTEKND